MTTSQTSTHFPAFHLGKRHPNRETFCAARTCVNQGTEISLSKNWKREAPLPSSFMLGRSSFVLRPSPFDLGLCVPPATVLASLRLSAFGFPPLPSLPFGKRSPKSQSLARHQLAHSTPTTSLPKIRK